MKGVAEVLALLEARLLDEDQGLAATLAELDDANGSIEGVPLVDTDPPTAGFALLPRLVEPYPRARLELDHYPAVLLVPQDSPRRVPRPPEAAAAGGLVYTVRHRVRVFSFVRGPDHRATGQARDRFDLAIDECFHRAPRLSDACRLDPTATVGSKSDVDVDETDQASVAGAFLDLAVDLDDVAAWPTLGEADTVALEVHPPHPALD